MLTKYFAQVKIGVWKNNSQILQMQIVQKMDTRLLMTRVWMFSMPYRSITKNLAQDMNRMATILLMKTLC